MSALLASLANIPALAVYSFIFIWLAAESAGAPIPNELVLLLAGSLAARGHVIAPALVLAALAGSLCGAICAYGVGLRGGRPLVLRFGRYIHLEASRLDSMEAWFARAGGVAIFLARITPFVRTVASYAAGMLRMPRRTFAVATTAGSCLWCVVLVVAGDVLGRNYMLAVHVIERDTLPALVVLAIAVAGYVWLHRRLTHAGAQTLPASQAKAARVQTQRHPRATAKTGGKRVVTTTRTASRGRHSPRGH